MYFFANWKMYLTASQEAMLLGQIKATLTIPSQVSLALFPTALSLTHAMNLYKGTRTAIGIQNISWVPRGAYTGAISALQVADIGIQYALVGHSERRHIFQEKNDAVRKKMEACFDAKITPVLCVGETSADREEGKSDYRLKKQLHKALKDITIPEHMPLFIAYEPVWAIGTGQACDPAEVEHIALRIREEVQQMHENVEMYILYGGSVKPQNVVSYTALANIDGVLVGGASTMYDNMAAMMNILANTH